MIPHLLNWKFPGNKSFTLLLFVNVFVFYLEDMCKGLVLGPPVKEVVPVVTSSQLLLAVHDAGGDGIV